MSWKPSASMPLCSVPYFTKLLFSKYLSLLLNNWWSLESLLCLASCESVFSYCCPVSHVDAYYLSDFYLAVFSVFILLSLSAILHPFKHFIIFRDAKWWWIICTFPLFSTSTLFTPSHLFFFSNTLPFYFYLFVLTFATVTFWTASRLIRRCFLNCLPQVLVNTTFDGISEIPLTIL